MGTKRFRLAFFAEAVLGAVIFWFLPASVYPQTPFYQGKNITIIHGRDPGGSGDIRVRAVIPLLQKYIPGNPTIVHEYMPGGGGRKAANYIYGAARPDGLTIGNVGGGVVASAVLGETGVQYNLERLIFIGSPYSATHYLFLTRREAGLKSLEKLRLTSGLRIGAQSVGHTNYNIGRIIAWLLGLKDPKFVSGYSVPERDVALLRGEIDAIATSYDSLTRNPDWLEKGIVDFHVLVEIPKGDKLPSFAHLPEIETFARSEKERRLLTMFRTLRLAGSPFIVPPGTPKERVEILKEAMRKTYQDPEFHKEYRRLLGEDPTPLTPEANEKAIRELPRDPETVELFKKFTGPASLPPR
ncbi:MAG: hypothetical protein ACREQA_24015 [Candidatus Binatia bacterium]